MAVSKTRKPKKMVRVGGEMRVCSYTVLTDCLKTGLMAFLLHDNPHEPEGKNEAEREADAAQQAEQALGRITIIINEYFVFNDPYAEAVDVSRRTR